VFFAALALLADPTPRLSHLSRFPAGYECARQADLCREHAQRLRLLHAADPWSPALERDLDALARWAEFWGALGLAHDSGHDADVRLDALRHCRDLLGPWDYRRGTHPPLLPAGMLPAVPRRELPRARPAA
jgi:hypothetical protein